MAGRSYEMPLSPERSEDIEDVFIEINDREPPFLRGQTTKAGVRLSPVRIVKNPEGTLQREIMNTLQIGRERREVREQQQRLQLERKQGDLEKIWEDPTEQAVLASQLLSEPVVEWRRESLFKRPKVKSNPHEPAASLPILAYKE
jgi:ATP-dependent RNA helicase DHX8/PRP22